MRLTYEQIQTITGMVGELNRAMEGRRLCEAKRTAHILRQIMWEWEAPPRAQILLPLGRLELHLAETARDEEQTRQHCGKALEYARQAELLGWAFAPAPERLYAIMLQADVAELLEDFEEEVRLRRRALDLVEDHLIITGLANYNLAMDLAGALGRFGRVDEALALLEETCSDEVKVWAGFDIAKCAASVLWESHRDAEAVQTLELALGIHWNDCAGLCEITHQDPGHRDLVETLLFFDNIRSLLPMHRHCALLRWLIEDSMDHSDETEALQYVAQLICILKFDDPQQALRMASSWITVAERLGKLSHANGLQKIIENLRECNEA